jgi:hypothetical protein
MESERTAYLSQELCFIVDLEVPDLSALVLLVRSQRGESLFESKISSLIKAGSIDAVYAQVGRNPVGYVRRPQEPPKITAPVEKVSRPGIEQRQVTVVDTLPKLESLVRLLDSASVISFDTETTSTDQMRAELVGISLPLSWDRDTTSQ